jgi:hypothetical protein
MTDKSLLWSSCQWRRRNSPVLFIKNIVECDDAIIMDILEHRTVGVGSGAKTQE